MSKRRYVDCAKSELDLFEPYPLDLMNEEGYWSYYSAKNLDLNQNEITIDIPGSSYYKDLSSCMLFVKARISKQGEDKITTDSKIAPVNNFLHSCFKQISIDLNGTTIENTNITYPYKAYLLNLLNYNNEAKDTFLSSSLFYKDTPSQMDNIEMVRVKTEGTGNNTKEVPVTVNEGMMQRRKLLIDGEGKIEMMGPLYCDLFHSDRFLMDNIPIRIKLWKSDDKFCLMGPKDSTYTVTFEEVKIRIRHQLVSPRVMVAHKHTLQKTNAIYPIKSSVVKIFPIINNTLNVSQIISDSFMPDKVIIAMTDGLSTTGLFDKNPFNFKHFFLEECYLRIDNHEKPYLNRIKLNFQQNMYLDGYMTLFDALNNHNVGNNISRTDWPNGFPIFAFNLQPISTCNGEYLSSKKKSLLTVDLQFAQKSLDTYGKSDISLIVFFEFCTQIEIDKDLKIHKLENEPLTTTVV